MARAPTRGQPREILLVVAKMTQMAQIKAIVSTIDPNAFMIIHDVADVMGRGFTSTSDIKINTKKIIEPGCLTSEMKQTARFLFPLLFGTFSVHAGQNISIVL
jgi:hypothetical protein